MAILMTSKLTMLRRIEALLVTDETVLVIDIVVLFSFFDKLAVHESGRCFLLLEEV